MDYSELRKGIEICNVSICKTTHNVVFYNKAMRAYYCPSCARAINASSSIPLCELDQLKLTYYRDKSIQAELTWE